MSAEYSNFEFLTNIIQSEPNEDLKELLRKIKIKTQQAETLASINQEENYSQAIESIDSTNDYIIQLYMRKMHPDVWDRMTLKKNGEKRLEESEKSDSSDKIKKKRKNPGKHEFWISEEYSKDWEKDESDIRLYVELFDLKGEANFSKHEGNDDYDRPQILSEKNGRLSIKRKDNNKVDTSKEHVNQHEYATLENVLHRLRNLYEYLCAVLVKCEYINKDDLPLYKSPKRLVTITEDSVSKILEKLEKFEKYIKDNEIAVEESVESDNKAANADNEGLDGKKGDDNTKILKIIIAIAAVILLLLVGLIVVNKMRSPNAGLTSSKGASVYYSKIIPYTEAGKYESYASSSDVSNHLDTYKAVALLSFIKNEAPNAAVVEDITCKFEEIEEIAEPNLKMDAVLVDNVLKIYVMNDGNGDSSEVSVDIYGDGFALGDYTSENLNNEIEGLQSGEIVEIAEYRLLSEEFIKQNTEEIIIVLKLNDNIEEAITILYDPVDDAFSIAGGTGDHGADITLFSVLDVDSKPVSISFNPEKITTIEDALRIETVLAPTKSCKIRFRGSYTVDGNTEETEPYTATVTVPIYRDGAFGHGGELTNELANDANNSKAHVKQVAQKYLYDPEALNPEK